MRTPRFSLALFGAAGAALLAACSPDSPSVREADAAESASPAAAPAPVPAPAAEAGQPTRTLLYGVDVTGVGYVKGSPTAPVTIIEFSDFGCPYCGKHARETFPALEREFIATGKVRYQYVPFVMGMFPNGGEAARAAECAGDQDRFWQMHDRLFANQPEWKRSGSPGTLFQGYARELGLDAKRFAACWAQEGTHPRTRAANDRAEQLGIRATPTFFINGRPLEGALPLEQFREVLTQMAP